MPAISILVKVCIFGSMYLQVGGSWSAHGLPCDWLSILWLSYYAFVFVWLMQLLSYMPWMKNYSMIFFIGK